jgi:hypothetical protein
MENPLYRLKFSLSGQNWTGKNYPKKISDDGRCIWGAMRKDKPPPPLFRRI